MKFFLKSKTIIGVIVGILPSILPQLGVSFSVEDGQLINDFVDLTIEVVGAALAIYGRFVAEEPLTVKKEQ